MMTGSFIRNPYEQIRRDRQQCKPVSEDKQIDPPVTDKPDGFS